MGEEARKIQSEIEKERANGSMVLMPSAIVPESFYRPVIERTWLVDDDIYCSQKKYRIRFDGLLKLANAAGIEWSPVDSGRTDNGSDKLYISFRAVGLIRKADGKLYPTAASYDLDLELVKEELEETYRQKAKNMNKSEKEKEDYIRYCVTRDWFHKRKHKATLAESGAKARVIRSILGLQSQYSNKRDITGRPFVIVRFVLDHQNPDIKRAMLASARENMAAIYGGGGALPPAPLPRFDSAASPGDEERGGEVIELPHKTADASFDQRQSDMAVDFENSDIDTQVLSIKRLCQKKHYDLDDYLRRAGCGLHQLSSEKRLDFFNYLNGLEMKNGTN